MKHAPIPCCPPGPLQDRCGTWEEFPHITEIAEGVSQTHSIERFELAQHLRETFVVSARDHVGQLLRELRTQDGLSQREVAALLGISRSSVANLEAGRQGLSTGASERLRHRLPRWAEAVASGRISNAPTATNESLVIDSLTITYVFQESRSPSEIIQVRRIRAIRAGVSQYILGLRRTDEQALSIETHVLWGGFLGEVAVETTEMTTINFGKSLMRGETHEFALRSWVQRDADPDDEIWLEVTRPTRHASVHLAFEGRRSISAAWTYELQSASHSPPVPEQFQPIELGPEGQASVYLHSPMPGRQYVLAWRW